MQSTQRMVLHHFRRPLPANRGDQIVVTLPTAMLDCVLGIPTFMALKVALTVPAIYRNPHTIEMWNLDELVLWLLVDELLDGRVVLIFPLGC